VAIAVILVLALIYPFPAEWVLQENPRRARAER